MERETRILVIEDSQTQALQLQLLLQQAGYRVDCVSTAEEGLASLERRVPDLLIVDYHLPGMAGPAFCRRVRMNLSTRAVPILMVTSEHTGRIEKQGLESGADDSISKSADDELFLLRVRSLLQRREALSNVEWSPGHFRPARLLLVDDSPTFRLFMQEQLGREGYVVRAAATAQEGLDCLAEESFDCVLVDCLLPDGDGIQLCERIARSRTAADDPVVILVTGQESPEVMTAALQAGADGFLNKSTDVEIVKTRIAALVRRKLVHQEQQRVLAEFREKELELVRARLEKEAAETRAALADQLARANEELQETNRKLKATQVQLVQSAKMASLGQLVAGIAHEINNPLAFLLNNLFTVDETLVRLAPEIEPHLSQKSAGRLEKARRRLQEMRTGLERVRDLVVKLRTFSRLDEGEIKTVDIRESLDSVLLFLEHKRKDRIEVEVDLQSSPYLTCYAGQLNQVLMNLLSNAFEAIEGEGKVRIEIRLRDDLFEIAVRDTGRGMSPEVRERIFEPFFTTKGVGEGTGLGLSISYGIVQAHGGTIEVHSEEGKGSEFVVKIPTTLEKEGQDASSG